MSRLLFGLSALLAGCLATAGPAVAYPNSVVFTPTGEAKAAGQSGTFLYTAYFGGNPWTWAGVNVGLAPSVAYGASGLSFGGLEVGVDVASQNGANPGVKPLLNAKAQLLVEGATWPSLATGFYGYAPLSPARSLNLAYAAATKGLSWNGASLGRLTLGAGHAFPGAPDMFTATGPVPAGSQAVVMGGYELPAWGPFSLAADHISGVSDLGGTNVVLNIELSHGTYLGLGYTFGNDRAQPYDSVYAYLFSFSDLTTLFNRD
jgi:hypothetical protein